MWRATRLPIDEGGRAAFAVGLSPPSSCRRYARGDRAEPIGSAVRCGGAEPSVGDRHHVPPYARRLVVSGRGAGLVFTAGRRLVDAEPDRSGIGALSLADGDLAAQAQTAGAGALRPGQSVFQRGLAIVFEGEWPRR